MEENTQSIDYFSKKEKVILKTARTYAPTQYNSLAVKIRVYYELSYNVSASYKILLSK
jgi:hypothetical protein